MVEDIMRDAEPVADRARIADVAPRAAAARAPDRLAVIVQLERDADRLRPGRVRQRGDDRTVDPARHRDDDPFARQIGAKLEIHSIHGAIIAARDEPRKTRGGCGEKRRAASRFYPTFIVARLDRATSGS